MSRAQYWGEQTLKEAEEIREKLLKSARGEGATRGVDSVVRAWPQRQHLQRLYARLLTKAVHFALLNHVEQDLWNVVFREPINNLQSSQRSSVAEHRRQAHVQLSMLVDSATGFFDRLLHTLCTTYAIALPARHSQQFYGIIQNYVDFGKQHHSSHRDRRRSADRGAPVADEDSATAASRQAPPASASSDPSRAELFALCHYCLIHLGDLARYGENMVHAQDYYQLAADLLPSDGHAFNQLAIVQTQLFGEAKSLANLEASQLSPGAVLSLRRLLCGLALATGSASCEQRQQQLEASGPLEAGTLHALVCDPRNECTLGALNALDTLFLYARSLAVRTPFAPALHNLTALFRAQLTSGNESLYGVKLGDLVNAHLYLVARLFLSRDAPRDIQRLADRVLNKFGKLLESRLPSVPSTSNSSAKASSNTGNTKSRPGQKQQQQTSASASAPGEEDSLWPGEGQQGTVVLKMVTLLLFVLERLAVRSADQPASAAGSGAPPAVSPGTTSSSTASALDEEDPAPRPTPLLVTDPSKASYFEVAFRYFCGIFEKLVSSTHASISFSSSANTKCGSLDQCTSMPALSLVLIWLHLHEELLFGQSSAPAPAAHQASSAVSEPSTDPQGVSMSEDLFLKQAAFWHNVAALLNGVVDRARKQREGDYDSASSGELVPSPARILFRPKRAPLPEENLVRGFLVLHSQFSDEDAEIDFTLGPLGSNSATTDERCRLLVRFGRWLALRCDTLARPYLAFDADQFEFSSVLPLENSSLLATTGPTPIGNGSHPTSASKNSASTSKSDRSNAVLQTISAGEAGANQLATQASNSSIPTTSAAGVIMNDPAIITALYQGRRGSSDSAEAGSAGIKGNSSFPRNLPPRLKRMAHSSGIPPSSSTPPPALGAPNAPLERLQGTATPPPGPVVSSALQAASASVPPRRRGNLNGGASLLGMPNVQAVASDMSAVPVTSADRTLLEGQPFVVQDGRVIVGGQQEVSAAESESPDPRAQGSLLVQHQMIRSSMLSQPFVPAAMRAQFQAGQMPLIAPAMTFPAVVVPLPMVPVAMMPHPASVTGAPLMQSSGSLVAMNSSAVRSSPIATPDGDTPELIKSTSAKIVFSTVGDSSTSRNTLLQASTDTTTTDMTQQRTISPANVSQTNLSNAQLWGQLMARKTADSAATRSSPLADPEAAARGKLVPVTHGTVLAPVEQASLVSRRSAANEAANPAIVQRELQVAATAPNATAPSADYLLNSLFWPKGGQETKDRSATPSTFSSTAPVPSALSASVQHSNSNTAVLRPSDKANASSANSFPGFNSFETWKNFQPLSTAQASAETSKATNGGAKFDGKDPTTTVNALNQTPNTTSWRLNPEVEPFQFHGSLHKPVVPTIAPTTPGGTEAPDLNSILGAIMESPAIADSPKYPAFSSNGSQALTTATSRELGARVGGKGSAPGSGRPLFGSRSDVPGSWDLWRSNGEQPIGFGGGFSSWSTSDELHSKNAWSSGFAREPASGSSRQWSSVAEESSTQEDGKGLFGSDLWRGDRSMTGLGHSNGDESKLTGFGGFPNESRAGERLEADAGTSIPAWSGRFE